jgi:hypothetical protein
VVIVDEKTMISEPHYKKASDQSDGDARPWSQRLGEVWRMKDPEERDTSLALSLNPWTVGLW